MRSPAAVAVAVIRDNVRPPLPDDDPTIPPEFVDLVQSCWHHDPTIRPSFLVRSLPPPCMGLRNPTHAAANY